MPALKNPKHEAFCREVAGGLSHDHAWVVVGNNPNSRNVGRLVRQPHIVARVDELRAEFNAAAGISVRYLQEQLLPLAKSDVTSYFEADEAGKLGLRDVTKLPPEVRSALQELRIDADGQVTVKTYNKTDAINSLLKTAGGFAADRIEVSGRGGFAIGIDPSAPFDQSTNDALDFMRWAGHSLHLALKRLEQAPFARSHLMAYLLDIVEKRDPVLGAPGLGEALSAQIPADVEFVRGMAVPFILACQRVAEGQDAGAVELLLRLMRDMTAAIENKAGLASEASTA